ncbi:MAG TPA: RHS repeat-associated core domain-containing protein [Verrucomicrobiae bacterium]|jgi:RHS repeat-associated protein
MKKNHRARNTPRVFNLLNCRARLGRFFSTFILYVTLVTVVGAGAAEIPQFFHEALVAVGGTPAQSETDDLKSALTAFSASKSSGQPDWSTLSSFLASHPQSPWNASLLLNLGEEYYQNGYFSRAMDAWQQSWNSSKSAPDPIGQAVANRAVAQLLRMQCRIGLLQDVKSLLGQVGDRNFRGSTAEMIETSRQSLWMMENHPEVTYRCGPHALERILLYSKPQDAAPLELVKSVSGTNGIPLCDVAVLSKKVGLNYQMAKRTGNAAIPVPSVAHWKLNHYGAVLKHEGGRYLLDDPTFGNGLLWITQDALDSESDGYFLIPNGELPRGWNAVDATEGGQVWGRGYPPDDDPGSDGPPDTSIPVKPKKNPPPGTPNDPCKKGMAQWNIFLMMADLAMSDSPVGYNPPVGPPIYFNVQYSQQASDQPAVFTYGNLGPLWNCDWISSLTFDTANAYYHRGQGGVEQFPGYNPATQTYQQSLEEADSLVQINATNYQILRPDGGKLIFSLPDNPGAPSRIFMTAVVDPQGNAATLAYDMYFRLTGITDAIGQTTTISYGSGTNSYLVQKVTDPFGRFATFSYNSAGELTNITDVLGMSSAFTYGTSDALQTLTTGYGMTTFAVGTTNNNRFVEITEPDGEQERAEQGNGATPGVSYTDPLNTVPAGILAFNQYLDGRDTYFWDRAAMAQAHGIYSDAKIYHFMHQDLNTRSPLLESLKMPSQNRIWYNYQGQNSSAFYNYGMFGGAPSKIGVVLDDGQTQLTQTSFNSLGAVTQEVDPVGRTQNYIYASNNIDLVQVQRLTGPSQLEPVASFTWNSSHLPLTITDASGQTTTYTYNSQGQPLTASNAKGQTTTFGYNSSNYLVSIQGPLGATDIVNLTYDAFGRVHTITDVGGYILTYGYDALDRLTNVSYPDGTFVARTYNLLDPATYKDRRGRLTSYAYDSLRQLVSLSDPLGRVTHYQWCGCGSLSSVIDPLGRITQWTHDPFGRLTAKIYPDGNAETYNYDSAGLLKSITDPNGSTKLIAHGLDNLVTSISYVNSGVPTPTVEYVYDPWFPRVSERIDGAGITLYNYNPITGSTSLGAGQLQSIDGPLPNDTITYNYDELGRTTTRTIGGVAENVVYDALGRIASDNNALGMFTYAYVGATPQLASISSPNGQSTQFSYFPNIADRRLKELWNQGPAGVTLSKFDYVYDSDGFVTTWTQQNGSGIPTQATPSYDLADRLTGVTTGSATYSYTYDNADNRLTDTTNGMETTCSYNSLNQLISLSTNIETGRVYQWDAEGRLTSIDYPPTGKSTEFTYDGLSHCVRVVEESDGNITSDKHFIWCNERICEVCDATGAATNLYFAQGAQIVSGPNAGKYYYALDRLGSITELTDSSANVRADYQYDPWGQRIKLSGNLDADFGFTGYYFHAPSAMNFAPLRVYDPALGRWLSRDPVLRMGGGANTYAYADNNPINKLDPLGADTVYVGVYNTTIGGVPIPEGHASIDTGDGYTGFYPDPNVGAFNANGAPTSTGLVRDPNSGENQSPQFVIPIYNVTPDQIQKMNDYIKQVQSDPCLRQYNLLNNNCAGFVRAVLGAGGINIGGSQSPLGVLIGGSIQSGLSSLGP